MLPAACLFLLLVGLKLGCEWSVTGGMVGFVLDDAWIHMTFGRNFAHGLGFGINPGVPAAASTSVIWSLWLAILHLAPVSLPTTVMAVKLTGVVLTLSAIAGCHRILQRFSADAWAQAAGTVVVLCAYPWSWAALSGMEIPLVAALSVWALERQLAACDGSGADAGRDRRLAVILWMLAALTRPETLLVALIVTVVSAGAAPDGRWRECGRLALWALLFLVPYAAFHFWLAGQPFPQTFTSKMDARSLPLLLAAGKTDAALAALIANPFIYLREVISFVFWENWVVPVLLVLAPVLWWKSRENAQVGRYHGVAGAGWLALPAVTVAIGWLVGPEHYTLHHGRYLAHTLLLTTVVATGYALSAWQAAGRSSALAAAVVGFAFVGAIVRHVDLVPRYAAEVDNINKMQVALGRWCGTALPPGLRLAVNDIGAIAYFGRQRLSDLEGLISPAANPFRRAGRIDRFIESERPDLVLAFPQWYPELLQRPDVFVPTIDFMVRENVTSGAEEMILFRLPWSPNLALLGTLPAGTPQQRVGSAAVAVVDLERKNLVAGSVLPDLVPVPMR